MPRHCHANFQRRRLKPYDDSEIEPVPPLSPPSPRTSDYDPWVPYSFPSIPEDLVIEDWEVIGSGVHGEVRRTRISQGPKQRDVVFKLYNEQNYDAYMREADAYMLLRHRGVKRCVPEAYCTQKWPRWKWDGNQPDNYHCRDKNEELYGLMMEYFPDAIRPNLRRVTLRLAEVIGNALERIHSARVVHRDIADRNLLLVRENGRSRVVWIDFSCSWCGPEFLETTILEWDEFRGFLYEGMVFVPRYNV
jgi:tRNA A-37 threonylcarbamoyl transferase component Bud32